MGGRLLPANLPGYATERLLLCTFYIACVQKLRNVRLQCKLKLFFMLKLEKCKHLFFSKLFDFQFVSMNHIIRGQFGKTIYYLVFGCYLLLPYLMLVGNFFHFYFLMISIVPVYL